MEEIEKLIEIIDFLKINLDIKSEILLQVGRDDGAVRREMMAKKRRILLAGHNFISLGCHTIIEGKIITEFDLTTWLVIEVFKKERLLDVDLIIKARNNFGDLVSEVNALNADYLISCHFNTYDSKAQGTEVLYSYISSRGKVLATMAQEKLVKHLIIIWEKQKMQY